MRNKSLHVWALLGVAAPARAQMPRMRASYLSSSSGSNTEDCPCSYGWNNNNSNPSCCRGQITEGCAQYKNGPTCWAKDTHPDGAYGWINLGQHSNTTAGCPRIPKNAIGSLLPVNTPLFPVSLNEALTESGTSSMCVLACNVSEVSRTGVDPCNAGTIPAKRPLPSWMLPPVQKSGAAEVLPGPLVMACFYGGAGWMKDPTMGMCGYNITLRSPDGRYCTDYDEPNGCPRLTIDPRRVPCCGGERRCTDELPRPMCCDCSLASDVPP